MYNRYIPQPDGTYRRNRMQEPLLPQQRRSVPSPPPSPETSQKDQPTKKQEPKPQYKQNKAHQDSNVTDFLKNLLPKDFDTSDFLIVLLILLMAGNCEEDQNNALLTLALYLFM